MKYNFARIIKKSEYAIEQRHVIHTISEFSKDRGYYPTSDELARASGIPSARLGQYLNPLIDSGKVKEVKRGKHTAFSIGDLDR